jgi:acyl-CoA thioesterase
MADESMRRLMDYFKNDRFAAANGIELVELRPGYARTRMTVEDRHLNSVGILQGGAIFTLADFAFAAASNSGGQLAVGLQMSLSCLQAATSGVLEAEAQEVARSRKISTCSIRITDEGGNLIALFQGTAFIKSQPFPPTQTAKP